jgi:diguanylate cyclase (GGDEF)-like protein/PAS domain S-box-containing protein
MEKKFNCEEKLHKLESKVSELENIIEELVQEKNNYDLITFPWIGNLGQWLWSIKNNIVYFNDKKITTLGYDKNEIPEKVGYEFFTEKLHKDDYQKVMDNMKNHLSGKTPVYEVEYRIKAKDGSYKWYYDRGRITQRDEEGKPLILSGIVFDISKNKQIEKDLKMANEQLKDLLIHDELTKVYNRRFFDEKIYEYLNKESFSLILFDLDDFKLINDTSGHDVGDRVLKSVCDTVSNVIKDNGYLCRWGGEEFIIILEKKDLKYSINLAEDCRRAIESCPLNKCEKATASFGVVSSSKDDDYNSIIKRVDNLMFSAKKAGRNCIKF